MLKEEMFMPIPFLVGAAIAGLVGVGVKKGLDAKEDQDMANYVNEKAQGIADEARKTAEKSRKNCGKAIEELGNSKVEILNESVMPFIEVFKKINNIELTESKGIEEIKNLKIDDKFFIELRELGAMASSLASGLASGATMGAITAFGAYGAVGALGTASTGAAIAGLSGVAATNATLAFLGGGSLAAGGLGVAGGTAVLGGLVAAPAIAILGAFAASKASANKDRAFTNLEKANEFKEEMDAVVSLCNGINKRAQLFKVLIGKLDKLFYVQSTNLKNIVKNTGTDYRKYSANEKQVVATSLATLATIKAVLDTPILNKEGVLTPESKRVADSVGEFISEQEA